MPSALRKLIDRPAFHDSLFLFGIILFSTTASLSGLGFYSDDWTYQAVLSHSAPHGLASMFRDMVSQDQDLIVRPVQLTYLVLAFKAFGQNATLYHLFNSATLGVVAVLLYLVLHRIRVGRTWSL